MMNFSEEFLMLMDDAIQINREDLVTQCKKEIEAQLDARQNAIEEKFESILQQKLGRKISFKDERWDTSPMSEQKEVVSNCFSLRRFIGMDKFSSMTELNTGTVSMFAVAEVVNKNGSFCRKLFISMMTFLFCWFQFFTLASVIMESGGRSGGKNCNAMEDCPHGTYCVIKAVGEHPKCSDCSTVFKQYGQIFKSFDHDSQEVVVDRSYAENQCSNVIGITLWNQLNIISLDYNEMLVEPNSNTTLLACLSFKHCEKNDFDVENNFQGHCDFIYFNMKKMDRRSWILVFFLGVLWTVPTIQDIQEATIEEMIMEYYSEGSLSVPVEIVRLILRLRRCVLPFYATSATIVLLVTDEVSSKNIILNFMAITFIVEADNIAAQLFLRKNHKELMDKVVENLDIAELTGGRTVFFWTRLQGLSCLVLFGFGILYVEKSMKNCDKANSWFFKLAEYSIITLIILQCGYNILRKNDKESKCLQISHALIELLRNYCVLIMSYFLYFALSYVIDSDPFLVLTFSQKQFYLSYPLIFLTFLVVETCRWMNYKKTKRHEFKETWCQ